MRMRVDAGKQDVHCVVSTTARGTVKMEYATMLRCGAQRGHFAFLCIFLISSTFTAVLFRLVPDAQMEDIIEEGGDISLQVQEALIRLLLLIHQVLINSSI